MAPAEPNTIEVKPVSSRVPLHSNGRMRTSDSTGNGLSSLADKVSANGADVELTSAKPTVLVKSGDLDFLNDNVDKSCGWTEDEPVCPSMPGRKLVGVDGAWYDVTDFIPRHPGGPIIEEFIGRPVDLL